MARILVLGAGLSGLITSALLAREGHRVTVLERDPQEPPQTADAAWDGWQRSGVNQFRLPHFNQPRWWSMIRAELPDVAAELLALGATPINAVEMLPETRRGPMRRGDEQFDTAGVRRPVLEVALARIAEAAGVDVQRGIRVAGLRSDGAAVPQISGVILDNGRIAAADLVVDCTGRRSHLGDWIADAGGRRPEEEREDCGFIYYARQFRSTTGRDEAGAATARDGRTDDYLPVALATSLQHYDSVSLLALPGDNGTWSLVITTSASDRALRVLRDAERWNAAAACYPTVASWLDGEPQAGVTVLAGIEDRFRRFTAGGEPLATGVVAVGDSWACTNPSLGRGSTIAILHAALLRDVLRATDDPAMIAAEFARLTEQRLEPLYRATVGYDRHRLAEIDANIAGQPYVSDDPRWVLANGLHAASLHDPDLTRALQSLGGLLAAPDEVFAKPGVLDRAQSAAAAGERYCLPGPDRAKLLAAIG
jgi:flavin-dependent dehydrogenase